MESDRFEVLSALFHGEIYYGDTEKSFAVRRAYSTDASAYQEMPLAVAIPKDEQDLKRLIEFAQQYQVTLLPRTAGTSLAGQVVGDGIVVDFSKYFNRIIELDVENRWVRVQPGVVRDELNRYLLPFGLMYGPETSTANRAMIGGMVGNNSSGLHSIKWGDARSQLLAANVLLDDGSTIVMKAVDQKMFADKMSMQSREGEIYRGISELLEDKENVRIIREKYPKRNITRRNTGYALDKLLVSEEWFNFCNLLAGSEGTLGFMTEARLNLIPLPPKEIALVCVHCTSLMESFHANIIALRHDPLSVELVDQYVLDCTKDHPIQKHNRFFVEGDPVALLIVEFRSDSKEALFEMTGTLVDELSKSGLGYAYPVIFGEKTKSIWDLRKAGMGLIRNMPTQEKPVNCIEDSAVDPADLPGYMADLQALLEKHQVQACFYGHAAVGLIHVIPFLDLKSERGKFLFRELSEQAALLVKKYEGSLSGEHGDGRLRGEFIPQVYGEAGYRLQKDVKKLFDPNGIFNAGKIVDTPPMDASLRYEKPTHTLTVSTYFDFEKTGGILKLAEKCSGSGDCRKSERMGGAMCPSFMATKDELHSTRSRANILRYYLTNSTKSNRFDHKEIKEAMDLCLSCKACKTECPSQVDVAKMKAEFLQQYYDVHGMPFRTWMIANFTTTQRLASYISPVYNFLVTNKFTAKWIKKILGFSTRRSLPRVGQPLRKWISARQRNGTGMQPVKKTVYFFCDEFTNYNDMRVGKAAYCLLEKLGYEVRLVNHPESGRSLLSKGLLKAAKKIADRQVNLFKNLVSESTPLIGIEPSAILGFRDEYPDLVDKDMKKDAIALSKNVWVIDEFIANEMRDGNIRQSDFTSARKTIHLHTHCFQKAFKIEGATRMILEFPENYKVHVIPSGCCGMAGSFGYEKEHFDTSITVANLVLVPALRKVSVEEIVAAPGTSCRHQIVDTLGRQALHPVEILWDAVLK